MKRNESTRTHIHKHKHMHTKWQEKLFEILCPSAATVRCMCIVFVYECVLVFTSNWLICIRFLMYALPSSYSCMRFVSFVHLFAHSSSIFDFHFAVFNTFVVVVIINNVSQLNSCTIPSHSHIYVEHYSLVV